MSAVEDWIEPEPTAGSIEAQVLDELAQIADEIEATRARELDLISQRLEVMRRGRSLSPPIHMSVLAERSRVAEVTVRKALGPVRR